MAAVDPMAAALVRIGFIPDAADAAAQQQGVTDIDVLELMTDNDVKALCKNIRSPGGVARFGNTTRADPGHLVSLVAEANLKLCICWIR